MQIEVICYFCFEVFSADLEYFEGENIEIWDCEVCCNPIEISYSSDGNDINGFSANSIEQ